MENLWFRYTPSSEWVLQNISFSIKQGAIALIGPNGSGKTTLLRVITKFLKPKKGEVYINGKKLKTPKAIVGKVAYVPTDPLNMLTGPTVESDVEKAAKINDKDPSKMLSLFKIEGLRNKKIYKLSQGEQKLLALASAYATGSEIFLLDEPSIGLDRQKRKILTEIIKRRAEQGIVIVATNDMRIATRLPQVMILFDGEIVAKGPTNELLYNLEKEWEVLPNEIVTFVNKLKKQGIEVENPVTPKQLAEKLKERL